jgi:hypothetical protein
MDAAAAGEVLEWARKIGTRVKAGRFDPGAIMAG